MVTKFPRTSMTFLALAALGVAGAGTVALAAGEHAGGHGHGFAFGQPGDPAKVERTMEIVASDNAFSSPTIEVKDGETIRFIVHNKGEFIHEFNIGTPDMHAQHRVEMLQMMERGLMSPTSLNHQPTTEERSNMAMTPEAGTDAHSHAGTAGHMKHDDPNSILLEPGETKELVWTFKKASALEFACNVPGHYESGMMGGIAFRN